MTVPIVINNVLTRSQVDNALLHLKQASWQSGTDTAGIIAAGVKRNMQATDESTKALREQTAAKIRGNEMFNALVRPNAIALMFSHYRTGDEYGSHVDAATMGPVTAPMRRDVSFTLWLSEPDEYEGGELIIESPFDEVPYKSRAGSMIVYPATMLHHVNRITSGDRLVVVGWARSLIRDPAKRELLFELEAARWALYDRIGKCDEIDLISRCAANLTRMWMED